MKDPETYLKEIGFTAPCAVRKDAKAVLSPETRVQVNHDLFYVSRPDYVKKIGKDPLKYAKRLTDPVTRETFHPTKKSPRSEFAGKKYFFSSDSTYAVFAANPAMFEFPPESMRRAGADSTTASGAGGDSTRARGAPHDSTDARS